MLIFIYVNLFGKPGFKTGQFWRKFVPGSFILLVFLKSDMSMCNCFIISNSDVEGLDWDRTERCVGRLEVRHGLEGWSQVNKEDYAGI